MEKPQKLILVGGRGDIVWTIIIIDLHRILNIKNQSLYLRVLWYFYLHYVSLLTKQNSWVIRKANSGPRFTGVAPTAAKALHLGFQPFRRRPRCFPGLSLTNLFGKLENGPKQVQIQGTSLWRLQLMWSAFTIFNGTRDELDKGIQALLRRKRAKIRMLIWNCSMPILVTHIKRISELLHYQFVPLRRCR